MKRMVKFCSLLLLIPFCSFAGLVDEASSFAENAKRLSEKMRHEAEMAEQSAPCLGVFGQPSLQGYLCDYDGDHSIEYVFCGLLPKLNERYCTRMLVRVLEAAFSRRNVDTQWTKIKRQLRMTFMPHEDHLAYVLSKASRILHSPEQYGFSSAVRELFAQYQAQHPLEFKRVY